MEPKAWLNRYIAIAAAFDVVALGLGSRAMSGFSLAAARRLAEKAEHVVDVNSKNTGYPVVVVFFAERR